MADAAVVPVGMGEIGIVADLYNRVMSPQRDESFFKRRFQGRYSVNLMVAIVEKQHSGFIVGFELMPSTYFTWLVGVLPEFRRAGIGTQLCQAQCAWARDHQYAILRFECLNQHRPMLQLAIRENFDIIGIRWDTATGNNVVIFEKDLR